MTNGNLPGSPVAAQSFQPGGPGESSTAGLLFIIAPKQAIQTYKETVHQIVPNYYEKSPIG